MSDTETDTPHEYAESRRYVCKSCDSVVRARWDQSGSGYPGSFHVGCECTIVPVVPQMSQAETPESWRVDRPECCRGVDVTELEEYHFGVCDYACPDCGATYRWDGTMSTAPESEEQPDPPDDQELLTDGGVEDVERPSRYATLLEETGIAVELVKDGVGIGWVTGHDGYLWFIRVSDDDPERMEEDVFENLLLEHNSVVIGALELPAFRELIE